MEGILTQAWAGPVVGFVSFSVIYWLGYLLRRKFN